jgi:cytidylate kinase
MVPHTYLEQGLSVLHARLRNPAQPLPAGLHTEVSPFITISRQTGAGATTLGRELIPHLDRQFGAEGHGWVFLDRDLLTQALTHHQLPTRLAEFLPEDRVSEIRAAIGELVGLHPSLWQLEQKVAEAILQLAHVGRVIFAGRASHLITRDVPGGLHLRLVASLETRIRRIAAEHHCPPDAAAARIAKDDLARRRFVRTNFGKDIDDPLLYDLVLNTDQLAPGAAARIVLTALRDRLEDAQVRAAAILTAAPD